MFSAQCSPNEHKETDVNAEWRKLSKDSQDMITTEATAWEEVDEKKVEVDVKEKLQKSQVQPMSTDLRQDMITTEVTAREEIDDNKLEVDSKEILQKSQAQPI